MAEILDRRTSLQHLSAITAAIINPSVFLSSNAEVPIPLKPTISKYPYGMLSVNLNPDLSGNFELIISNRAFAKISPYVSVTGVNSPPATPIQDMENFGYTTGILTVGWTVHRLKRDPNELDTKIPAKKIYTDGFVYMNNNMSEPLGVDIQYTDDFEEADESRDHILTAIWNNRLKFEEFRWDGKHLHFHQPSEILARFTPRRVQPRPDQNYIDCKPEELARIIKKQSLLSFAG